MRVLGVDTSSKFCTIAILEDGRLIADWNGREERLHSSTLIPGMDKLLKDARLSLNDIDGFSVGLGPGSFTGLRIGVTTMRGIAISCGKPIVGIGSLDCIAQNAEGHKGAICTILDAKRGNVYASFYKNNGQTLTRNTKYLLISLDKLVKLIKGPTLLIGDGVQVYEKILSKIKDAEFAPSNLWYPKGEWVARLGIEKLRKRKSDNPMDLAPLYMYHQECQVKIKYQKPKIKNTRPTFVGTPKSKI